jgi:hypothetical protein
MKDEKALQALVRDLELAVERASRAGYANADCVLTDEVKDLIARIKAGTLAAPVQLACKAGPLWNFCETSLGERKDLQAAWSNFTAAVEDLASRPGYAEFVRRFEQGRSRQE